MPCLWADEPVGQALMVALAVIMRHEVGDGCPQRLLSKQDHVLQAGFLDSRHES
jgi:hypothetical protein